MCKYIHINTESERERERESICFFYDLCIPAKTRSVVTTLTSFKDTCANLVIRQASTGMGPRIQNSEFMGPPQLCNLFI